MELKKFGQMRKVKVIFCLDKGVHPTFFSLYSPLCAFASLLPLR